MKKVLFFVLILMFSISLFGQTAARQGISDFGDYGIRIEPDRRLIVVLASLEAAGIKTSLTEQGEELRVMLEKDIREMDQTANENEPSIREKLTNFIRQYRKRHSKATDAAVIAPFISMAYTLEPVPDLTEPDRSADLPGDLLDVLDYSPLIREFYRRMRFDSPSEPGGEKKIDKYFKMYQKAGDGLRPSTSQMIGRLLDYLNTRPQLFYLEKTRIESTPAKKRRIKLQNTESRVRERRFFIVPELLLSKGTVNLVNVGDDYYAIVPPNTNLAVSEVRRAYLQFVLDPVVLNSTDEILKHRDPIKVLLDERRRINPNISPDFLLAVSRSLVAAVDARQDEFEKKRIATIEAREKIAQIEATDNLIIAKPEFQRKTEAEKAEFRRNSDERKRSFVTELNNYSQKLEDETAVLLSDAFESGAVLAFYFADKLKGMEDSGFDLTESIPNMISALDASSETNRLEQFADSRARGQAERERRRGASASSEIVIENPVTKRLLEIEEVIQNKDFDAARRALRELLLDENITADGSVETSRIYYQLGRLESLSAEAATDADTRNYHLVAAKNSYDNVLKYQTEKTDQALISLSYVGLARIYEFFDQNEYAVKVYEAAIKVGDVKDGAYQEAVAARARLLKDQ